jgi:hypothetical protein
MGNRLHTVRLTGKIQDINKDTQCHRSLRSSMDNVLDIRSMMANRSHSSHINSPPTVTDSRHHGQDMARAVLIWNVTVLVNRPGQPPSRNDMEVPLPPGKDLVRLGGCLPPRRLSRNNVLLQGHQVLRIQMRSRITPRQSALGS